ncbi:MAG TPA: hypothetical protein VL996_11005 [Methylocella sp.]|nr:hypothetical protein [Methylocella sp.]
MSVVKLLLLGFLRLAFFGILRAALFAYILFLPETAVVSSGTESNGHGDDTASYGITDVSGHVGTG